MSTVKRTDTKQERISGTEFTEADFMAPGRNFLFDTTTNWYTRQRGAIRYLARILTNMQRELCEEVSTVNQLYPVSKIISDYTLPSALERHQMYRKLRNFTVKTKLNASAFPDVSRMIRQIIEDNWRRQQQVLFFRKVYLDSMTEAEFLSHGF